MRESFVEEVTWHRRGEHRPFVGSLTGSSEALRFSGRDPLTGIDVALSIPMEEIERVGVTETDDEAAGERCVVLELAGSEPILCRSFDASEIHTHLLARTLDALTHAPVVLVQGGTP